MDVGAFLLILGNAVGEQGCIGGGGGVGWHPKEAVHLVGGHQVEDFLDGFDGENLTTEVEEDSAPLETWIVEDGAFGQDDGAVGVVEGVGGQNLDESLVGVKEACFGIGGEANA